MGHQTGQGLGQFAQGRKEALITLPGARDTHDKTGLGYGASAQQTQSSSQIAQSCAQSSAQGSNSTGSAQSGGSGIKRQRCSFIRLL